MFTPKRRWFKPRKFLKLAERLINDPSGRYEEPSRIRTSVGRAYYASFLYTKEKMERSGIKVPEDHMVHDFVIDTLMDMDRKETTTIGSKLDKLRENRRIADYYMDTPIRMNEGKFLVRLSEEVINGVELINFKKK